MRGCKKRGLSPTIASVLMILLVVVLASIVFLWTRGFIAEQVEKFGKPIEEYCALVDFDAAASGNVLEVTNRGNIDIFYLDIKLLQGGRTEMRKFNVPIYIGETDRKPINLLMSSGEAPDKIIAYPVLIGNVRGKSSNRPFTCLDYGITLKGSVL